MATLIERGELRANLSLFATERDARVLTRLVDRVVVAFVGAALGIVSGIGLAELVNLATPLPATVSMASILVAVILGVGVGVASGVYPASRAARLDPVAALRHE